MSSMEGDLQWGSGPEANAVLPYPARCVERVHQSGQKVQRSTRRGDGFSDLNPGHERCSVVGKHICLSNELVNFTPTLRMRLCGDVRMGESLLR